MPETRANVLFRVGEDRAQDADAKLIYAVRDCMAEQLALAGYAVPPEGVLLDLTVEYLLCCENPPPEAGLMPTDVWLERPEDERQLLGTAETWSRSETRDIERIMSGGQLVELRPVPGSARSTLTLTGFKPAKE